MSTGTTSFEPMYPMIPHIFDSHWECVTCQLSLEPALLPAIGDPVLDRPLFAGADRQRAGGHVLANCRSAADVRALADRDRRDELRVAANERAVLDHRLVLVHAVVVA